MNFLDKVCVITGGAAGIGWRLTREFAREGAKVAFVDMEEEAGAANLRALRDMGCDALFVAGDLAEEETIARFADAIVKKYGGVDFLIHNACLTRKGILSGCSYADFNYVLRVGVSAPYELTRRLEPYFRPGGCIVNISSTRQGMSQADTESYTAAKGGISALTRALAVSLSGRIRVNSVSPGWIDVAANEDALYTKAHTAADRAQHPSGRVGEPGDIARVVLFLCREENSFINAADITVDGGMTKKMIYTGDEGWHYDV